MLRGLHKQCDKANWEDALATLDTPGGRASASDRGGWGDWTPLHIACKRNPPLPVVLALMDGAPESVGAEDMYQRLPLHHAAEFAADVEVLAALVDAAPDTVYAVDADGRTPLHLALGRHGGGGGGGRDEDGPHHHGEHARQGGVPVPAVAEVELLLGDDAAVAETADAAGNTPLHSACENVDAMPESVVAALVEANPSALTVRNRDGGNTPLCLAMLKCTEAPPPLSTVRLLLGHDDARVAAVPNGEHGRTPLHLACKIFADFTVLDELLLAYRRAASTKDAGGSYPLDILEEEVRHTMDDNEEMEEFHFKSDLLFAHFPDLLPYRADPERLRRIEQLVEYEARNGDRLSDVGRMLWIWLCTCDYGDDDDPQNRQSVDKNGDPVPAGNTTYTKSVERVVIACENDPHALAILGGEKTADGVPIGTCIDPVRGAILQPFFRFLDRYLFHKRTEVFHFGRLGSQFVRASDFSDPGSRQKKNENGGGGGGGGGGPGRNNKPAPVEVVVRFEADRDTFLREKYVREVMAPSSSHGLAASSTFSSSNNDPFQEGLGNIVDGIPSEKGGVGGPYGLLVPVVQTCDADRVGTREEERFDAVFQDKLRDQDHLPRSVHEYRYRHATIMRCGDRTLEELLRHEGSRLARDPKSMLRLTVAVGRVLEGLHKKDVVHGNVCPRNVLRMKPPVRPDHNDPDSPLSNSNDDVPVPLHVSLIGLESAALVNLEYQLGTHNSRVGDISLTPELVARLDRDERDRYLRYWTTVRSDAPLPDLFHEEDVIALAERVDAFLFRKEDEDDYLRAHASFRDLWRRIARNARLWRGIAPVPDEDNVPEEENDRRREEDEPAGEEWYYVPKCYFTPPLTGSPFNPHHLPYDLVPASPSHDTWGYGVFLFDLYSRAPDRPHGPSFERAVPYRSLKELYWWDGGPANAATSSTSSSSSSSSRPSSESRHDYLRAVKDPLVRDLVKVLLRRTRSPKNKNHSSSSSSSSRASRPRNMVEVFLHPYFDSDNGTSSRYLVDVRQNLLQTEYERRQRLKEAEDRRRGLANRTVTVRTGDRTTTTTTDSGAAPASPDVSIVSYDTRARLRRSTSSQWRNVLPREVLLTDYGDGGVGGAGDAAAVDGGGASARRSGEVDFPTSFVVLPYELQCDRKRALNTSGASQISHGSTTPTLSCDNPELANVYALQLADIVNLTTIACQIGPYPAPRRKYLQERLHDYVNFVRVKKEEAKTRLGEDDGRVLAQCEHVVSLVEEAVRTLTLLLETGVLAALPHHAPGDVADFLVLQMVNDHIDWNRCRDILRRLKEAETALAALLTEGSSTTSPQEAASSAEKIVRERMSSMIDTDFKEEIAYSRSILEDGLVQVIKSLAEDSVTGVRNILKEKIESVTDYFDTTSWLYLVDEYDGSPLMTSSTSSPYPIKVETKLMKDFWPSMRLAIKSITSSPESNLAQRITKMVGLSPEQVNLPSYSDLVFRKTENEVHNNSSSADPYCLTEFLTFQEILNGKKAYNSNVPKNSRENCSTAFLFFKNFLERNDPRREYANMKRIKADDESILWTTKDCVQKILREGNEAIDEFLRDCKPGAARTTEDNGAFEPEPVVLSPNSGAPAPLAENGDNTTPSRKGKVTLKDHHHHHHHQKQDHHQDTSHNDVDHGALKRSVSSPREKRVSQSKPAEDRLDLHPQADIKSSRAATSRRQRLTQPQPQAQPQPQPLSTPVVPPSPPSNNNVHRSREPVVDSGQEFMDEGFDRAQHHAADQRRGSWNSSSTISSGPKQDRSPEHVVPKGIVADMNHSNNKEEDAFAGNKERSMSSRRYNNQSRGAGGGGGEGRSSSRADMETGGRSSNRRSSNYGAHSGAGAHDEKFPKAEFDEPSFEVNDAQSVRSNASQRWADQQQQPNRSSGRVQQRGHRDRQDDNASMGSMASQKWGSERSSGGRQPSSRRDADDRESSRNHNLRSGTPSRTERSSSRNARDRSVTKTGPRIQSSESPGRGRTNDVNSPPNNKWRERSSSRTRRDNNDGLMFSPKRYGDRSTGNRRMDASPSPRKRSTDPNRSYDYDDDNRSAISTNSYTSRRARGRNMASSVATTNRNHGRRGASRSRYPEDDTGSIQSNSYYRR